MIQFLKTIQGKAPSVRMLSSDSKKLLVPQDKGRSPVIDNHRQATVIFPISIHQFISGSFIFFPSVTHRTSGKPHATRERDSVKSPLPTMCSTLAARVW